ncbi:MAG: hypothetical protein AB7O49_17370 [Sphingomonadales bacterium]
MLVAVLAAVAAPVLAQDSAGIDVHIAVSGLTEDYEAAAPLSFVVTRARLEYALSANGSGVLASRRIGNGPQLLDESFARGREPRGFTIARESDGRPMLRIWAQELAGEANVPVRFVRGDWSALSAGRPVTLVASARALQRAHGVTRRIGQTATGWLRGQFSDAIPFVTIDIGDLRLKRMELSSDDVVIAGTGRRLVVTYPDGELSYGAPVSFGR